MTLKSTFSWLPVTTLTAGTELRLPLHVVKGAHPGPTLGLSGVVHGDELIPSVNILQRVLDLLNPAELSGTVMVVPICNPLGAAERSRQTPGDGLNLNAVFFEPGHSKYVEPVKTVTEQMARVLTDEFLTHLDYHIDFHCGGDHHSVHVVEFTDDSVSRGMARAFNMPVLLHDEWRPGQMWRVSEQLGAKVIVALCGGGGLLYQDWLDRGVLGAFNVMRHLGMLPGEVEKPPKQYVLRGDSGHEQNLTILRPREGGIIVPDPALDARAWFNGQPVVDVPVLGRLLNKYDLTVRQTFETPFERTLMMATVLAPSWHYPGNYAYILADADKAGVLD